jgi:hypothetical protein
MISGVLGADRCQFDVWSRDVLVAAALETASQPNTIHMLASMATLVAGRPDVVVTPSVLPAGLLPQDEPTVLVSLAAAAPCTSGDAAAAPAEPDAPDSAALGAVSAASGVSSLRRAFQAFDPAGTGFIGPVELRHLLRRLGFHELGTDEIRQLFLESDLDGDGRLSFFEFEKAFTRHFVTVGAGHRLLTAASFRRFLRHKDSVLTRRQMGMHPATLVFRSGELEGQYHQRAPAFIFFVLELLLYFFINLFGLLVAVFTRGHARHEVGTTTT